MTEGVAAERRPGLARLRAWPRRHPLQADAALMLALLALLSLAGGPWLGSLLLMVPLIWRRRYPLTVFGVLVAIAIGQWMFGRPALANIAMLVALYTVAASSEHRKAVVALGVMEFGVVLAVLRWSPPRHLVEPFLFMTAMVVAAFVLGRNVRTRRAYTASLEDRARRAEHERDQQAQLSAAAERAQIAREMHDVVTHNLSVMIALADGAEFAASKNAEAARDAARQVSATGRQALTEMHRLLGVLRGNGTEPMRAPQPGIEQLDELATQVRSAGLPTTLTMVGTPFPVPPTAQLAVYRVVQEALTNVLKHAVSPTAAKVTLRYEDPVVAVEIDDDGKASAPRPPEDGHGLGGMAERVAMFDGQVEAGPRPGGGWRVRARLASGSVAG